MLKRLSGPKGRVLLIMSIVGPGLVTAVAGNDAGGIATYASAGAAYGYDMLWMIFVISFSLAITQSMGARMGAVTGKGLSDLIREHFGVRWTVFAMLVLLIANAATTISEFAGIAAGMELLGVSRYISVPLAGAGVWLLVVKGSYRVAEKVFLFFAVFQLSYVAAGFLIPDQDWGLALSSLLSVFAPVLRLAGWVGGPVLPAAVSEPLRAFPLPVFPLESGFILLFIASIGTTITPWMQFYIQSSIRDKGITVEEYKVERWDAIVGAFFLAFVAFFIIVTTAGTLHREGIAMNTAADAAIALEPLAGMYSKILFAVGLVGASTLAASIVPLATSYAVCEALGWESGVSKGWREAPAFFALYTALIVLGAGLVLLPNPNLIGIMLISQDVNGILVPVVLIFMIILVNDRRLMGKYVNSRLYNVLAWATTAGMILLTALLLLTSFFPGIV